MNESMSNTSPTKQDHKANRFAALSFRATLSFGILFGVMGLAILILVANQIMGVAEEWTQSKVRSVGMLLATVTRAPLDYFEFQGPDQLNNHIALLQDIPGAMYGAMYNSRGDIIAVWNPHRLEIPTELTFSETDIRLDDLLIHYRTEVKCDSGNRGTLQIGFSKDEIESVQSGNVLSLIAIILPLFLLGLAGMFFLVRYLLVSPIDRLKRLTSQIVQTGNLTTQIPVERSDELGELAQSFQAMMGWQRGFISSIKELVTGLNEVTGKITSATQAVSSGADVIGAKVEETSISVQDNLNSTKIIAQNVDTLSNNAEQSSSAILEMAHVNDEVTNNINNMADSVSETSSAIEQMSASIKQIASNINELNSAISITSEAMRQMEASMVEVEQNAKDTAKLSELVSKNSDAGVHALEDTVQGIDKIRESTHLVSQILARLVSRLDDIGNILSVINEITDQTNLLALNAAIISAQAGKHGHSFSVVANEIRALADRTRSSTTEIAKLIENIQEDSEHAVKAMETGMQRVSEGVRLGGDTSKVLSQIKDSTDKSANMVRHIANATAEQVTSTKDISLSIQQIAHTIQQINSATKEQAHSSDLIMKSATQMNTLNKQVHQSSQEQASGSRQITQAIEKINTMIQQVDEAQQQQTHASEQMMGAVEAIKSAVTQQINTVQHLEAILESLHNRSSELKVQVEQFVV